MQTFSVDLYSNASNTFRCNKAAMSVDLDINKKLHHHFEVTADITTKFNIGLILGASGSGKTTLAKKIYGDFNENILDLNKPIIDQFDSNLSYDECANILCGIGLSQIPCWIRPAGTLSNGQRARAEAALLMHSSNKNIVIDEWTSVVDRITAKIMSHTLQKHARKYNREIVVISCHYDIIEWLSPDWIIDCNKQTYENRRELRQERTEKLHFEVRETDKTTWKYFSKFHYLNENIPCGLNYFYGLFHENNQIGFQAFSNYIPIRTTENKQPVFHSNRVVIHPDFVGIGLGLKMTNEAAKLLKAKLYCEIRARFSSKPMLMSRIKSSQWELIRKDYIYQPQKGGSLNRNKNNVVSGSRKDVITYTYKFIG